MRARNRYSLVIASVASILTASVASAQERGPGGPRFDERYYQEDQPEDPDAVGQKLCSVFVPDGWRDSIPVPQSWRWSDCRDYAASVGATQIHLMCVFSQGAPKFSMGGPGRPPQPDCGWGRPRQR